MGEKLNAILLLIVQVAVAVKALALLSWWSRPWVPVFARQHAPHASETLGRQVFI